MVRFRVLIYIHALMDRSERKSVRWYGRFNASIKNCAASGSRLPIIFDFNSLSKNKRRSGAYKTREIIDDETAGTT